jgi:hypothetical protein
MIPVKDLAEESIGKFQETLTKISKRCALTILMTVAKNSVKL